MWYLIQRRKPTKAELGLRDLVNELEDRLEKEADAHLNMVEKYGEMEERWLAALDELRKNRRLVHCLATGFMLNGHKELADMLQDECGLPPELRVREEPAPSGAGGDEVDDDDEEWEDNEEW